MQNFKPRALICALTAVGAFGAVSAGSVFAQTAPAPKTEKIEVTGSNIKRIEAESSAPIQVITQEEIRRSGKQTVTELLRELPINAAGGLTELTGSGSFSSGAASVSLRGLGSTATLVLLNGRRIAPYGLADPNFGQSGVTNLNAIPVDVIERIEILKDGASAIYGSEAIAGVINIILRKDYKGGQVGANATTNNKGKYNTQTAVASIGFGDLAKDRYNVFANFEGYKQKSVRFVEVEDFLNRQEFRDVYGTGQLSSAFSPFLTYITDANGAPVASPGAACPTANRVPWNFNGFNLPGAGGASGNVCLYDNVSRSEIVPKVERASAFARGTFDISGTTQLYAEGSYVKNSVYFLGFPQAVGFGSGATFNPRNGRLNPAPQSLAIGHPNNPFARATFVRARFDAVGPQDNEVESKTSRVVAGIKTVLGKYDFESGVMYNRNQQDTTNYNSLRYDRLVQAFGFAVVPNAVGNPTLVANPAGGFYNWAAPNSGTITADSLRIDAKDKADSKFTVWDAKLSGEIGQMAGGAAVFASGIEYRKETRTVRPDANKLIGNIFGRGVASVDGSRTVSTAFGELILPMLKNVEVQLAARYDRYSDYGSSLTPKVAASWAPTSNLKIRGSFARGFRAPALTEITRSSTSGFFNGVDDPRRCLRPTLTIGCGISIPGLIQAFPGVQPEKAETYSAGFVWEVNTNTNLSVDYFNIARRNEISFLSLNEILLNEGSTNPLYANRVFRDAANTNPAVPNDPGAILYVSTAFSNLGETRVRGVDFDIRHRISLGEYGRLTLRGVATHYTDQRSSGVAGQPLTSYSGFRNAPEWRGLMLADWEVGNWTSTGGINVVGPFKAFSNPETQSPSSQAVIRDCGNKSSSYLGVCTVSTYVTFDAGTEYRGFKNWRFNFTVRNIANTKPSFDPLARPFNLAWYQPQGMNFVAGVRYTWN
jgi:iron complex outermembrane receptor protein